jgi:EmrB/QacA subfamily drug resistance transporter
LQWTVDLYVLVLAALMMAAGSISDLLGHRRVFVTGLVIFAVPSLACGMAPSTAVLIAARGVQGLGAAAMYATNAALLGTTYTGRDRSVAFGVWGAANGAAAAAGPILGGLLTEHVGWRAIFLVNLPVAAVAVLVAMRAIGESRGSAGGRVDAPGTATFTLATTLVVYGLIRAGEHGWTDPVTVGVFVAGGVAASVFLLLERRRTNPMIDLALFRRPSFSALMLGGAALTASFANLVFVSLWAQSVLGLSPMAAVLVLTPLAAVAFVVAGASGRLLHNIAPRRCIGWGLLLVGAGTLLGMLIGPNSGWTMLIPELCLTGLGVGLASPALASAALTAAPSHRAGMANASMNTFRQLGYAIAIPILATLAAGQARRVLANSGSIADPGAAAQDLTAGGYPDLLAHTSTGTQHALEHLLRSAYAAGLDRIFLVSGITALVAGVAVLGLVRSPTRPEQSPALDAVATWGRHG